MSMGIEKNVALRSHGGFHTGIIFQGRQKGVSVQGNCKPVHSKNRKGDNDLGQNILQTQSVF